MEKSQALNNQIIINLRFSFCGGEGKEFEPNRPLLPENEDFLLLIKDLLDAIETMEKSADEAIIDEYFIQVSSIE